MITDLDLEDPEPSMMDTGRTQDDLMDTDQELEPPDPLMTMMKDDMKSKYTVKETLQWSMLMEVRPKMVVFV